MPSTSWCPITAHAPNSPCGSAPSLESDEHFGAFPGSELVVAFLSFTGVLGYAAVLIDGLSALDGKPCASLDAVLVMLPASCK